MGQAEWGCLREEGKGSDAVDHEKWGLLPPVMPSTEELGKIIIFI